jgi:hypothetical protein
MATQTHQILETLNDILAFMAVHAGGSVPNNTDDEYDQWVRWIAVKQEEFAVRGFWRRLLKKDTLTIDGEVTTLPDDFYKPNGLYVLDVDDVDWANPENEDEQRLFVGKCLDSSDDDYGKWQVHFLEEEPDEKEATIWYFANPPEPTTGSDLILLPGDMIGFGALSEYFRQTNMPGSQDDARLEAENRFQEYMALEELPAPYELLRHSYKPTVDRIATARSYYESRSNRTRI